MPVISITLFPYECQVHTGSGRILAALPTDCTAARTLAGNVTPQYKGNNMSRPWFILTIICPLAIACAPLTNLVIPAPTTPPTPTPTPTPAPDPCSAEAMRKLADEVKSLAQRYIESNQKNESWLSLLPDLMALRRDAKQFLNLPRCAERMRDALSNYTDLDSSQLQRLIDGISGDSIEDAMQAARYWLDEVVDLPAQGN